jgi:hypothetical protein
MKKITFLITAIITITCSYAQDPTVKELQKASSKEIKSLDSNGWKKQGTFLLNLNQGALSNWVAGGEQNTLGVNSLFNFAINYRHDRHEWDNFFDLALGFQDASSFEHFRKIDDRIDITSKYGYRLTQHWYLSFLANFNSQFLPGYDYSVEPNKKISNFLAPGKVLLSPGLDYKTASRFSFFISPLTVRWIFKSDPDFFHMSKFGVDSASKSNKEVGAFVSARYTAPFTKWVTYTGRIDLFSNYKRNPENVDLFMTNLLTMKFSKWLATNISFDLIYDDDVLSRLQLKEILGIGLTLKL